MEDENTIILSQNLTLEEKVIAFAGHYQKTIKPGSGFFFDYSQTPELKKPIIDYIVNKCGWKLEYNNTFLRRPENKKSPT